MNSPESNLKHAPKLETSAEAIEAPAVETEPVVSNEELEQHVESSEARIDQQSETFAAEGEQQLNSAANTMSISNESLTQLKQDEGLDSELASLNAEEAELAATTKQEIVEVVTKENPTPEVATNDNQAPVTQESPFMVSDPMIRRITDGTYGKRPKAEKRPKSISEGGTKYVPKSFDSLGWEETAPKQEQVQESKDEAETSEQIVEKPSEIPAETIDSPKADTVEEQPTPEQIAQPEQKENVKDPKAELRELLSRFQEHQQQQEPEPAIEASSDENKSEQEIVTAPLEAAASVPKAPERVANVSPEVSRLQERFQEAGAESSAISIPNGGEFSEAIIFKKQTVPGEKMVRLYRGVNQMDTSLLKQTPYAMRMLGRYADSKTIEAMQRRVDSLAQNPTYENLMAYVSEASPHLKSEDLKRVHEDIKEIEEGILEGYSVRRELIQKQIEHLGGTSEHGLTPFVSASFDPVEAAQYGNGGIMVIDVPISQLEDFSADSSEVNIKGVLGKEYVTAVLFRDRNKKVEGEEVRGGLENALVAVSESEPVYLYSPEELAQAREQSAAESSAQDIEQWQKDVERVREKYSKRLIQRFNRLDDMGMDYDKMLASSAEQGTDVYTAVKNTIYDRYAERLQKLGNGRTPEDYEYGGKYNETKRFNRAEIDDDMLFKLQQTVERAEELEERRRRTV